MTDHFSIPTVEQVVEATAMPTSSWYHNCHAASLTLVRSGILPKSARVARGFATGVGSQHSWVVVGHPYDPKAPILDITRWSYIGEEPSVWSGSLTDGIHVPHGYGHLEDWRQRPRPETYDSIVPPDPEAYADLSAEAKLFLAMVGSLDIKGWLWLMRQGMQGWPSEEIIVLMKKTPRLASFVPIDIEGMLTDRNPSNVYF